MTISVKNERKAEYNIDPIYLQRWSPRSFLEKDIPEDILLSVLEAARWAPSAFNYQPWRFIVAKTKEEKETFYSFISEGNLTWCKKAPVLILILSSKLRDGQPFKSHSFDVGAAWGYLSLEAVRQGLMTHPMTGFDFIKARELLHIPDEFDIEALVAIGYQGDKEQLPESLQEREAPNHRKPLNELLFSGQFGLEYKSN